MIISPFLNKYRKEDHKRVQCTDVHRNKKHSELFQSEEGNYASLDVYYKRTSFFCVFCVIIKQKTFPLKILIKY